MGVKHHCLRVLAPLTLATLCSTSPLNTMASGTGCTGGLLKNETILDGDGDPHQNFVFQQVSDIIDCDDNPSGSISYSNSSSVGWSMSVGFAGDFINGGFSVSSSVTTSTSESIGCKTDNGTHSGSLCQFQRVQVTAFTAKHRVYDTTCGETRKYVDEDFGVIFAPNAQDASQTCFYNNFQINLPCGAKGTQHVFHSGPAGGPTDTIGCVPWLPPTA